MGLLDTDNVKRNPPGASKRKAPKNKNNVEKKKGPSHRHDIPCETSHTRKAREPPKARTGDQPFLLLTKFEMRLPETLPWVVPVPKNISLDDHLEKKSQVITVISPRLHAFVA